MTEPLASAPGHLDLEAAVAARYAAAAEQREEALCCPVNYSSRHTAILPDEILERDYGCGDPSPFVQAGDVVLDLGAGGGKLCYILAQLVGPSGRVIGVDCNPTMLALARKYQDLMAQRLGFRNVEFRHGMIQDLRLDLDRLQEALNHSPVHDAGSWFRLRGLEDKLRRDSPLVADESIDCVVSNCVLNLVRQQDRRQLFAEVFRVLRKGGRAAISDIVCDEECPEHLRNDPELWSGCLSGAFREDRFLQAFEEAGFHGIQVESRQAKPWRTIEGIEFRSMTVVAYKGKQGPCLERRQALVYRGPFRRVDDDDGHTFVRGQRTAVCDKTFHLLQRPPYQGQFEPIEPYEPVALDAAEPFDCRRARLRQPGETKGTDYRYTSPESPDCQGPEGCC